MARLLGILGMVLVLYLSLMGLFENARTVDNHQVLAMRLGFYGILTVGVGVLIVSGGIDLSIGSLVGLSAVAFGKLLEYGVGATGLYTLLGPSTAPVLALVVILGCSLLGLGHGLLVTKLRLQPFLVTLCGLFMYRGLARWWSGGSIRWPDVSDVAGASEALRANVTALEADLEGMRSALVTGNVLWMPAQLWLFLLIAAVLGVLLHASVYGRYLCALGHNEQAARYAGIATDRYKILAYVQCSTLAGLGGVLFMLYNRTVQASSAGNLLELYAITGAVLGGCSLRGGEGTVPGMLLGAAVLPMLAQICNLSPRIGSDLEFTVIGGALLLGTVANELLARYRAVRRHSPGPRA
jgi:ribose transport system permease protein